MGTRLHKREFRMKKRYISLNNVPYCREVNEDEYEEGLDDVLTNLLREQGGISSFLEPFSDDNHFPRSGQTPAYAKLVIIVGLEDESDDDFY